jgi:hypothetical protein
VLPELRRRYANGKRTFRYREPSDRLQIAIHIRRGDVIPNAHPMRYSDNDKIARAILSMQLVLDETNLPYQIHIMSEGERANFGLLNDLPVQWHLNSCAVETFDRLVKADILVMAKSSFSYAAALLNSGLIVYEPFWCKPMAHWILLTEDGYHPAEGFRAALSKLLRQSQLER